jgi:hypothetical protein
VQRLTRTGDAATRDARRGMRSARRDAGWGMRDAGRGTRDAGRGTRDAIVSLVLAWVCHFACSGAPPPGRRCAPVPLACEQPNDGHPHLAAQAVARSPARRRSRARSEHGAEQQVWGWWSHPQPKARTASGGGSRPVAVTIAARAITPRSDRRGRRLHAWRLLQRAATSLVVWKITCRQANCSWIDKRKPVVSSQA